MTKILILGSNSYIGQHVTNKLSLLGNSDISLSDFHQESFFNSANLPYLSFDLTKNLTRELEFLVANSDIIYLFSGLTGTIKSIVEYSNFINVNEIGILKILEFLRKTGSRAKIVFPSTRLIYKGKKDSLLKEVDEKEFKTVYAVNKFACESYLKIFSECYGLNFTIFRICVPYGNTLQTNFSFGTISHFINQAQQKLNIRLFGDGLLRRTFTHIDDLSDIMVNVSFDARSNNEVFNVGGNNLSLKDVACKIANVYNVKVEYVPWPDADLRIESGDTVFDDSKLISTFGITYRYNFFDWADHLII